jgi:hypothetical protein
MEQTNLFQTPEQQRMHELVIQIQTEIETSFPRYQAALKELDKYRGLAVNDDNVKEINTILFKIQESYNMLYPLFYYIKQNAETTKKIMAEFEDLMQNVADTEADILKTRSKVQV